MCSQLSALILDKVPSAYIEEDSVKSGGWGDGIARDLAPFRFEEKDE